MITWQVDKQGNCEGETLAAQGRAALYNSPMQFDGNVR
jgi:hypothetical protein